MQTLRRHWRALIREDNIYTFRLWDWIFPDLFVPLKGRAWARRLPNLLTYSRLILSIPVVTWLATIELSVHSQNVAATAVLLSIVILRLTDILDGRAARDLGAVSDLGSKLDPLADGIIGFGLAFLAALVLPDLIGPGVEYLLIIIIAIRLILDSAVMVLRFLESRRGIIPLANKWGKLKYNLDFIFLLLLHAALLFQAAILPVVEIVLMLGAVLTPLTMLLGWKNLHAHWLRFRS